MIDQSLQPFLQPFQQGMTPEIPSLQQNPADRLAGGGLADVDEKDLVSVLMEDFRNDIADKQEFGWVKKREWDIQSYYGLKNQALSNWPWKGSSNFPYPLTPTLVDTAWANIKASMYSRKDKLVSVRGVGVEDIRKAPLLEDILNWQLNSEIDIDEAMDSNIFRTFLHGDGILKIVRDVEMGKINVYSVDIENIFLPIDAKGCQIEETDHIFQVVPLTWNDLQQRKSLGIYRYPDEISPGANIASEIALDTLRQLKDQATGTDMSRRVRREIYFILECYKTYYSKSGSVGGKMAGQPVRTGIKPKELVVWLSPNGGRIQNVVLNDDRIRPFGEYHVYRNPGRFFSMSLPEKIRHIQEKINYADKQNTDALDRSISPAGFADDLGGFNKAVAQRVPGGLYQKGKNAGTIEWEPVPPRDRGFETQIELMKLEAERLTGLIDISVGAQARMDKTLGQTQIRTSRADIRFTALFDRFEQGLKKTMNIIYEFDNRYMPRDKKVKILGYADFKSIDELFPNEGTIKSGFGLTGKYDFKLAGMAVTDLEREQEDIKEFCKDALLNPLVTSNPANLWKITEMQAEAYGIRNIETKITKPKEVLIMSVDEALERIVSGQYDVQPRPGIDVDEYIFEIQLFKRSESYSELDAKGQFAIELLLRRVMVMQKAELFAMQQKNVFMQKQSIIAQLEHQGAQGGVVPQVTQLGGAPPLEPTTSTIQ